MNTSEDYDHVVVDAGDSLTLDKTKKDVLNLVFQQFNDSKQMKLNDLDFLISILNMEKSKLLSTAKNSGIKNDTTPDNDNNISLNQFNMIQAQHSQNQLQQANYQSLMQQSIPSLISQIPSFYAPNGINPSQHFNFLHSIGNLNPPPSLMSLISHQSQAPSLMSLQTNFNNNNNSKSGNSFKRY